MRLQSIKGLLLVSLLCTLSGCGAVGALAYKVAGPKPIEPKYTPAKEPMVVMVERYSAPSSWLAESETLSREVYRNLSQHEVAQQIDPIMLINLRGENPEKFKTMTVSQIGASVTARQVLYVNLVGLTVETAEGGGMTRGALMARVKLISVANGETLWPTDAADGYPVAVEIKPTLANDRITPEAIKTKLIRQAAPSIARLFYKWQPDTDIPED